MFFCFLPSSPLLVSFCLRQKQQQQPLSSFSVFPSPISLVSTFFSRLERKKLKNLKTHKNKTLKVWSNALFFSQSFGQRSCFFSRKGLQSIPVSWWGVVVASILMFVALAVNVMPAYSICVHLGLDHKPHLLPSDEHREHFRMVAEQRKKELEEERERLAKDSSGAAVKRQQLQRMVSRRLPPRQSDQSAAL